ncbi:hypothetical protein V8C44DRAFT_267438 [Trichoderma aethiopicum]
MNKDEQTSPVAVVVCCLPYLLLPSTADKAADSLMIHSELPNNASRPFLSRKVVCSCLFSFFLTKDISLSKRLVLICIQPSISRATRFPFEQEH